MMQQTLHANRLQRTCKTKKILMVVVFFIFLGTGKCCLQCLLVLCLRLFLHGRRCLIGEAIRGFKLQPKWKFLTP